MSENKYIEEPDKEKYPLSHTFWELGMEMIK